VRAGGALWRTGEFGVVVLGTDHDDPVTLVGTGVDIWNALACPRSRDDLVELLVARFDVDREQVAVQIAPVIDELVATGVLEVVS
jgi:hypothetical protein